MMRTQGMLLALAALLLAAACRPAPPPVYQVRGESRQLPVAPARDLMIRHEAIPDFKDEAGRVVGMEAMTMPFTLAPGVELGGLAPGDRVEFTLEVRWDDPANLARITRLVRLPPGTRLAWDS
jgi:Cu/Ag efflux protein CusF